MKKSKGFQIQIFLLICFLLTMLPYSLVDAATKSYGIVIADQDGDYTFYDLNKVSSKATGIEISKTGNVMIPLKKLTQLMPNMKYSYNLKSKKVSVINTYNGRKVVYTINSKYYYYYSSAKASGVKKTMAYKMYVSSTSNSVMIHMSAFKCILGTTNSLKYYKVAEMQTAGYDTSVYSGLIAYNPYQKIATIPKSTTVTGISKIVKVTIPEGYSVAQICNLLVKKGVCTSTDVLFDAINNYKFDLSRYSLVSKISENENRCFRLEGYLFPDTYEFYRLSKAEDVIGKFLRNAEVKITNEDRLKAESLGYTMDEILTIASLIEKETGNYELMPNIASVIYNRLNKPMKLRFDAGTYYVERYIKPYITGNKDRYNQYYNMYKCSALPAGPICNPGVEAIKAALNPAETDYLYFYSDTEGIYHFSVKWVKAE